MIQDLLDYVSQYVEIAPASPQCILQLLRREGYYNYAVINRRQSRYLVTAVYDPPKPSATQPERRQPTDAEINAAIAKLVACGMTATNYSVDDPDDPGMLDVVGFDGSCPAIISKFARA